MKRTVLILLLICLSVSPAWAVNWCDAAPAELCLTFEEGVTTIIDQSANDFSFTKIASATQSSAQAPTVGGTYSAVFDGSGDSFTAEDAGGILDFEGSTEDFSGCSWYRPTAAPSSVHWIMGMGDNNDDFWRFLTNGATFAATTSFSSLNAIDIVSASGGIAQDTWVHLCIIFDRDGNAQPYIDGSASGSPVALSSEALSITDNTFFIGRSFGGTQDMDGYLDEIIIYSGLLDSTDINDIMDNGLVQAAAGRTRRFF